MAAVPKGDVLCRFVRTRDWSTADNRPKPGAFKQPKLSVWHKGRLLARGIRLEDLRIEHLSGFGQAHYTAGDFIRYSKLASQLEGVPFEVRVEWRSDDESVGEPWRRWRDAHVQVEAVKGPDKFLVEFRRQLSLNARETVPPDELKQEHG